jgi:hypothetical protein
MDLSRCGHPSTEIEAPANGFVLTREPGQRRLAIRIDIDSLDASNECRIQKWQRRECRQPQDR